MSLLRTHNTDDIFTHEGSFPNPMPGEYVYHRDDKKSFGTVVANIGEECSVLWGREPKGVLDVQIQQIQSQARKLSAKWSVEEAADMYATGMISKSSLLKKAFEVEEEYENLSFEEIRKFHEEGADIQMHQDGRTTVKRRTDNPPEQMFDDPRIGKRSIRTWR